MPLTDNDYIVARLQDFWGRRTPWQRRLWNLGSTQILREVLESAHFLREGHFSEKTVSSLAASATRQVGRDPGFGPGPIRKEIASALSGIHKDSAAIRKLQLLVDECSTAYLREWEAVWRQGGPTPQLELTARSLGSHLLDQGFSPDQLYRWVSSVSATNVGMSVADLFSESQSLDSRTSHVHEVAIPIRGLPRQRQPMPATWMEAPDASKWLQDNGPPDGIAIRHNGAFLYSIEARDPWRAVEMAIDIVQSLGARVVVGLPGQAELQVGDVAIVAGSPRQYSLGRPRRQVDVHAMSREGVLYDTSHPGVAGRIRAALNLLAPLESGAPESAVAGGWAAIEALLKRNDVMPTNSATEMGALVACSLPRAELTTLAYAYSKEYADSLANDIKSAASNQERCNHLLAAIRQGSAISLHKASDSAALARIEEIVSDPGQVLGRVQGYVSETFTRLYRQRNLVLHAGRSDSVGMLPTLRYAPPLVGAAVDRIVHAGLRTPPIEPQVLVAKAEVAMSLIDSTTDRSVANLLE